MNTEITDIKNANGWICFDVECRLCAKLARLFRPLLYRHRFALLPLQTPWVTERLASCDEELLSGMRLLTGEGQIHGGADALIEIARRIWWAKPVYWLSRIPLVQSVLVMGYRWLARNRTCLGGSCSRAAQPKRPTLGALGWIIALLPTALAVTLEKTLPGWIWMWAMALALFIGAKLVTIPRFLRSRQSSDTKRLLTYALLWPGMDVQAFCGVEPVLPPRGREWAFATAKTLFGAAVIWMGVRLIGATHPFITGWVGMIGIVLLLHFGFFQLLSLLWRARGINAQPIMHSPAATTSLSRFWGGSWNAAFTDLMNENLFKPLSRRVGSRGALFLIFIISGALHELVISLPAHGGYGLPAAYFILQGLALLFEHTRLGRKLGIDSGLRGWCFVALVAGVPAFCLFHPVFIHNVILPMLHAIGAT